MSEDVTTLSELKTRSSEILRKLESSDRPLLITQNGRIAAVMVSPATYDALAEREEFVQAVARGLRQADAGMLVGHEQAIASVRSLLNEDGTPA